MSLNLRSFTVDNFRKFRAPFAITGITDGLNIIIEPNETGKSTLLEALRAAFFVRHSTKNQLAQSYAPHGENVAPKVEVDFDINGTGWSLSKQFLKNPSLEVRGPTGRSQGDEAEALLQELLGFERDNSRSGDTAAWGTLGLLWVAQADALAVTAPGHIVRDTVLSTLEAEVGTIMGGAIYDRVRSRVGDQFDLYWTATGRPTGRQATVKERLDGAKMASESAQLRLTNLEQTFGDLETARKRLKIIDREVADNTDLTDRARLVEEGQIARIAAQIRETRTAEHGSLTARVASLEDLQSRHEIAAMSVAEAEAALTTARTDRSALAAELFAENGRLNKAKDSLTKAKAARQAAYDAFKAGRELASLHRRVKAIVAAKERHAGLKALEDSYAIARETSGQSIAPARITELEELERAVTAASVAVTIGATKIELKGPSDGITINGDSFSPGERTITAETRIALASSAELIIRPPASASSAAAELQKAKEEFQAALEELGVADIPAARERNDAAKTALAEMRTIEAQISALTPSDEELGLAAGAPALKLLIAEFASEAESGLHPVPPDLDQLQKQVSEAESNFNKAEGVMQSCFETLRLVEAKDTLLAKDEVRAERDLENAHSQIKTIEQHSDFADLPATLDDARKAAAKASVNLEEATRNATAHNEADITKKIEIIDARLTATAEAKRKLETDIARLEATVDTEGGKGLSDIAAAAREEYEAAAAALERSSSEAETLKLLRATLEEARLETSQSFLGPVARRAKKHIERLLPGCDLTFSENLSLESIVRAGVSEGCNNLSRGTQEQLAVLTRLAFADMLLEQGRPVSLILDDPLVYADDARLDIMTEILTEAAERMQVILLTCRERAFRHVPGNRITIPPSPKLAVGGS